MRILVAEDDRLTRLMLVRTLERWGDDVIAAADGEAAWAAIREARPPMALVDWMMPAADGLELCRRVRAHPAHAGMYLVLLTARDARADLVAGLDAGADEYLVKPIDVEELQARLRVGRRILGLQEQLATRAADLERALSRVRQLSGLLPICSYCKRIRSDRDYWQQIETYLAEHTDATLTHGICPTCLDAVAAP